MDIVEALRNDEKSIVLNGHICLVNHEAADEIEKLREERSRLREMIRNPVYVSAQPQGCVCPVGAEKTCQGFCPRKPMTVTC